MNITKYTVFVDSLSLPIRLGCQPAERLNYQTAVLDLDFDLSGQAGSFELDKTVCYLTASQLAVQLAAEQEWDLIENFLSALALKLFEKFHAANRITAGLKKFVVPGCESAGARLEFVRH